MRVTVPFLFALVLAAPGRADDPPKVDLKKGIEFTGRAEANVVGVRPRATGYIERVLVKEGDAVKKGDVLVELDARPYRAKLEVARARIDVAKAVLKRVSLNLDQVKDAFAKGLVGKGDVTKAESEREEAEARVVVAKAVAELAGLELAFTKLTAPIDGRVGRFTTTEGNLVVTDGPAVVSVIASDPIAVAFDVDERTLLALARALGSGGKPVVEVGLGDEEGYPHKAVLEQTTPTVDPATGTARFRATLANPKGLIIHGMFLRARLTVQPGK
jgi:RND family efflux transporter MFP subunit